MAQLLNVSINLSKVDKAKIIKGQKGSYLNLTIEVKDEKDQYDNDVSTWQAQEKSERESGQHRNYLGDGRIIWTGQSQQAQQQTQQATQAVDDLDNLL